MASKFCITITFVLVWLYAGEVVHTNLRSSVLSICEFMSRVGSFLAPFLVYLVSSFTFGLNYLIPWMVTVHSIDFLQGKKNLNKNEILKIISHKKKLLQDWWT